jgi:hypothetical protein
MRRVTASAAIAVLVCTLTNLSGASDKRIDLAAVVTKKDAETALGEAVKDPQPRNEEGADGYYSRCSYYSQNPGRSLVLRLRQAGPGQLAPAKQLEEVSAGNSRTKPVPRLGDQAAFACEGAESSLSRVLMLYVAKGNAFVTVGIGGINDEKVALEKARTVARKILAKL